MSVGKNISLYFFNNTNSLNHNIFNFFYKTFVIKKNNYYKDYLESGFQKLKSINEKYILNINKELNKQASSEKGRAYFELKLSKEIIEDIKKIVEDNLREDLKNLEKMYKSKCKLSHCKIVRNYHINQDSEAYSNYFHTDGYTLLMQKMFINLDDIDMDKGPLEIIRKPLNKILKKKLGSNNYRLNLITNKDDKFIYRNIGKKGDVLLCDTTTLLHKAGIPNKTFFRDVLFLEFVFNPNKNSNSENLNLFFEDSHYLDVDNANSKKNAKINTKIQLLNQLKNLIKKCLH